MCILEDLKLRYIQECKECKFNNICKLDERLKHIQSLHEAKRIIIKHPEILNENLYTKYN